MQTSVGSGIIPSQKSKFFCGFLLLFAFGIGQNLPALDVHNLVLVTCDTVVEVFLYSSLSHADFLCFAQNCIWFYYEQLATLKNLLLDDLLSVKLTGKDGL